MKTSEFRKLIREEVQKAIKEAYIDGNPNTGVYTDVISSTGDAYPDIRVMVGSDAGNDTFTLSQKIAGKVNTVILSKKQFKELKTLINA